MARAMMVEASGLASAPEPIPPALARHLVDLMAQQRMLPETLHMLELCRSDDAMVVTGSDFDLRLQILSIDDALDIAAKEHDKEDPPKYFERLLKRFDLLHKSLPDTNESIITEHWPSMRAAIVRQAALSHVRARKREYGGEDKIDWSAISLEAYLEYVNRLIPIVDEDMDALDDVVQMTAAKEKRDLTDVFLEKRRVVNGVKVLMLLKDNRLALFEDAMKAFTRGLHSALLPTPKLLQRYSAISLLDEDVGTPVDEERGLVDELKGSSSNPNPSVEVPTRALPKRKRAENVPAGNDAPETAQALAKANEHLQREMTGHPGTVPEALAIGEAIPQPRNSAQEKPSDATASSASEPGERSTEPARKRPLVTRTSPGEQVDFEDSQSVDEPQPRARRARRATLVGRPLPQREPPLESPAARGRRGRVLSIPVGTSRRRVPWTEEEVNHLEAAVSELGVGKWKQALSLYKFQDCRTAVDLKDKWRNITK